MRRARRTNARPRVSAGVDGGRNVVAARGGSADATSARARRPRPRAPVARRDRVRRELAPAPEERGDDEPDEDARRRVCGAGHAEPMARSVAAPTIPSASRSWARCHRATAPGAADLVTDRPHRAQGRGAVGVHDEGRPRPARGAWSSPSTWRRRCAPALEWGLQPAPPGELRAHDAPAREAAPPRAGGVDPAREGAPSDLAEGLVRGVVLRPVQRHRRLQPEPRVPGERVPLAVVVQGEREGDARERRGRLREDELRPLAQAHPVGGVDGLPVQVDFGELGPRR